MVNAFVSRRFLLAAAGALLATASLSAPAGAAGDPFRIGLLVPLSGAAGAYGPAMVRAAEAAAERINTEAGGVLDGRRLEIVVEDTESNPSSGVTALRKLIDVDGIEVVAGLWNSSVAMAIKPIVLNQGLPMLVAGSADQITEGDNRGLIWRFQAKSSDWGPVIARAMLQDGITEASTLGLQNPFTLSMIGPFEEAFVAGGGRIVDQVLYNPGQAFYRAEVEQVFAAEPQGVFLPALLPDFTSIAKEVYRNGFTSRMYTLSIAGDSEGKFIAAVGPEVAEGINHLQPTPPLDSPAYARFLEAMDEPEGRIFLFASSVYDQIATLALAAEQAGTTEAEALVAAIPTVTMTPGETVYDPVEGLARLRAGAAIDYSGAGSTVDFDARGDLTGRAFSHYRIEDGQNVLVQVVD